MTTQEPGYYRKLLEEIMANEEESSDNTVISQQDLRSKAARGTVEEFIKNTPVALVPYSRLKDYATPDQVVKITPLIGGVDSTSYDEATLKNGYLVFQWDSKNNKPDLYVADPNSVQQKYAKFKGQLPTDEKSASKVPSLVVLKHLEMDPSRMPFFVKKVPTRMVRAKDLGIEGKVIETQWNNQKGKQTVAEGGYIVIEDNGHCYTVAPDANGLPIGYIKA